MRRHAHMLLKAVKSEKKSYKLSPTTTTFINNYVLKRICEKKNYYKNKIKNMAKKNSIIKYKFIMDEIVVRVAYKVTCFHVAFIHATAIHMVSLYILVISTIPVCRYIYILHTYIRMQ